MKSGGSPLLVEINVKMLSEGLSEKGEAADLDKGAINSAKDVWAALQEL